MTQTDLWLSLSREVAQLHEATSFLQIVGFLISLGIAALVGNGVRVVVGWLWRLNLDRGRRLAALGTIVQVLLAVGAMLGLLTHGLRVAPGVTLLLSLAALPTIGIVLRSPVQNAMAGITLLLQRNLKEGDDILLEDGRTGHLVQIRLMTTLALAESGAQLVIPNALLVRTLVQKEPHQPGVGLRLLVATRRVLSADELARARTILLFSPFRASGSPVSAQPGAGENVLELTLRVVSESSKVPATREILHKVTQSLGLVEAGDQRE